MLHDSNMDKFIIRKWQREYKKGADQNDDEKASTFYCIRVLIADGLKTSNLLSKDCAFFPINYIFSSEYGDLTSC